MESYRPRAQARPRGGVNLRLGIEASNLRVGGGLTHLRELLRSGDPREFGISSVVVWAGKGTLDVLPQRESWLRLQHDPILDRSLPLRVWWQSLRLARAAKRECDLLFVPGGSYGGSFRPFVTMSQNLLPFEPVERARYGLSRMRVKLAVLERAQTATFHRAAGVIFLNEFARAVVERRTGPLKSRTAIIPYGLDDRFRFSPRPQHPIGAYSTERPFRLLYVSTVDVYKHQWIVAEAVARLRQGGVPVSIEFQGPLYDPARTRLDAVVRRLDPRGEFLLVSGPLKYDDLPKSYAAADGFVFASSCENLPNILLEAMAAGLPIASSRRGPMPAILGNAGVYFDPESVDETTAALQTLSTDADSRTRWAQTAFEKAKDFSWTQCASDTYRFLNRVAAESAK